MSSTFFEEYYILPDTIIDTGFNFMKIAFVYDCVYPFVKGGVEKRIYELACRLRDMGHEVHIFGMKFWDDRPSVVERQGLFYHGVCRPAGLYVDGRRSVLQALYVSSALFVPLLRAGPFDVIDVQAFPYFTVFPARTVARLTGARLVVTWHEVWGDYWQEYLGWSGRFGRVVERLAARFGDCRVAVSATTRRRLQEIHPKGDLLPVVVIPNGVDSSDIRGTTPAEERSDVIFVGRLIREKNVDLLIEATALVQKNVPDIRVCIIGEGPEQERLRKLIQNLALANTIEMTGFFSQYKDVIRRMKASKVFVSPSEREGFGIAALEALVCGLSVITIEAPMNAVCDLVETYGGEIVTPDAESLAAAMQRALSDTPTGTKQIYAVPGWDNVAENLSLCYQELLSG